MCVRVCVCVCLCVCVCVRVCVCVSVCVCVINVYIYIFTYLYILSIFVLFVYINLHTLAEARAFERKPASAHRLPMAARSMARGLQPPACKHVGQALRSQLARICEAGACTMEVAVSRSEAMGNSSGDEPPVGGQGREHPYLNLVLCKYV